MNGCYPEAMERSWESAEMMRARVMAVLKQILSLSEGCVACHGMMMQALTGGQHPQNGEIVEWQ